MSGAGGDVRGFLRATVGCAHRDAARLTDAERTRCDEIAGGRGRDRPQLDPIPAEKRAYYDAVAKAYADLHNSTPVARQPAFGTGAAGAFADPPTAMPGRMPSVGCRIVFGVPRGAKSYRDKPPHSFKLEGLPCFVTPPVGVGTEETGAQAPASLRERQDNDAQMHALDAPAASAAR